MATISVSLPADGTTADVADYNTPITTIVSEINGNLDNANIKSAAAIATSKIATDGGLTRASLQYGLIRYRQGGTSGDNAWNTSGTTNTDTSAKATFIQAGTIAVTANPTTVTFPVAFSVAPIVVASVATASGANAFVVQSSAATTTQASFRCVNDGGSAVTSETICWVAYGQ